MMKLQSRFILYLLLGIVVWVICLGVAMPIVLEIIVPQFALQEDEAGIIAILLVSFLYLLSFGWYVSSPLLVILRRIHQIANHEENITYDKANMYNRKGKLKVRYRLYREVIWQLDDMQKQLMQAKVEREQVEVAKREWLAGVSHDLKTPLTYIKGYTTLLLNQDYEWTVQEQRNFVYEIKDKSQHLETLIADLNLALRMDEQRMITLHCTKQNIVTFIQSLLAANSNAYANKGYTFELHTTMEYCACVFDASILQRALQNIYQNAILHNAGPLCITTTLTRDKEMLCIRIEDNGEGMDEDTLCHLFTRYYRGTTTDSDTEGTGLGMAIVQSLIEAHDGNIVADSVLQQGTCFTITLPIRDKL